MRENFYFAGVIEGDGSLFLQRNIERSGRISLYPRIQLRMAESRIINVFAEWVNKIHPPIGKYERPIRAITHAPAKKHYVEQFAANIVGRRAEILMRKLYPIWFSRRQGQVKATFKECSLIAPTNMSNKYSKEEYLSWLAGLLDAEGCFDTCKSQNGKRHTRFQLGMTDRDVVSSVASWLDITFPSASPVKAGGVEKCVRVCGPYKTKGKPVFTVSLQGRRSVELMRKLQPYMHNEQKLETIRTLAGDI